MKCKTGQLLTDRLLLCDCTETRRSRLSFVTTNKSGIMLRWKTGTKNEVLMCNCGNTHDHRVSGVCVLLLCWGPNSWLRGVINIYVSPPCSFTSLLVGSAWTLRCYPWLLHVQTRYVRSSIKDNFPNGPKILFFFIRASRWMTPFSAGAEPGPANWNHVTWE